MRSSCSFDGDGIRRFDRCMGAFRALLNANSSSAMSARYSMDADEPKLRRNLIVLVESLHATYANLRE